MSSPEARSGGTGIDCSRALWLSAMQVRAIPISQLSGVPRFGSKLDRYRTARSIVSLVTSSASDPGPIRYATYE